MKEVKFRAWLKNRKVMGKVLEIHFNKEITVYAMEDGAGKTWFEEDNENAVIMQYTGLKDRNGKEIYEGDILIMKDEPEDIGSVAWDSHDMDWIISMATAEFKMGGYWSYELEVIGNIYENPELL